MRDGEKGPVATRMVKRRVQTRLGRKRTGPEEWLVITRRPLTDDRMLAARASRDATDNDTPYRYHYSLTPVHGQWSHAKNPLLQNWRESSKQAPALKRASNEAKVRWAWTSTKCARGKAGITIWRCP